MLSVRFLFLFLFYQRGSTKYRFNVFVHGVSGRVCAVNYTHKSTGSTVENTNGSKKEWVIPLLAKFVGFRGEIREICFQVGGCAFLVATQMPRDINVLIYIRKITSTFDILAHLPTCELCLEL